MIGLFKVYSLFGYFFLNSNRQVEKSIYKTIAIFANN